MVVVTRSSMDVWNRCKLAVRWLKDVILERGLYVRNSMPPVKRSSTMTVSSTISHSLEQTRPEPPQPWFNGRFDR
jgi:hypothetical protein